MKPLPLLMSVLVCLGLPLRAQTPTGGTSPARSGVKPELPTGPLLRAADNFSQWQTDFAYPDDSQKTNPSSGTAAVADARPRKTVTTKTGSVIHEQTVDVLNKTTDVWFNHGTQYTKSGSNPTWFQADPGLMGSRSYNPLPASGFRDLEWITADNYVGAVDASAGRRCLVFAVGGTKKLDLGEKADRDNRMAKAESIAYIDADTRLPILVRIQGETRSYHFDPPPTLVQTLPADLADQIRKGEEGRKRLLQPAARPY